MAKISVIIPVYGVEKYLDRCVSSVVNQTFKNLEIILVDDGSPDNCPDMCDSWAQIDSRIKVIHQKNKGLSAARNTGLDVATGQYITFVDSDDWIIEDTYEFCLSFFEKYKDVDVVQYDLRRVYSTNKINISRKEKFNVYKGKTILEFYLQSSTLTGSYAVWRCLFRASLARKYRFREGKINEDIDYKYKVLRDCRLMIDTNQIKYCYWQEGNSTSSGKLKSRDLQLYEAAEELYNLTKDETFGKIAYYGKLKKARTPFSLLTRILIWGIGDPNIDEKELISKLIKELRQNLKTLILSPISISRRILALSMAINFYGTKSVYKIFRRFYRIV